MPLCWAGCVVVGFAVVPSESWRFVVAVVVCWVVLAVVFTVDLTALVVVIGVVVGLGLHDMRKLGAEFHEPSRHFHSAAIRDGHNLSEVLNFA